MSSSRPITRRMPPLYRRGVPRSRSTPLGPLVAYAAVSGPAWGIGLAIAISAPLLFAYSVAALLFAIPGVVIGAVTGALLSPLVTLASAVAIARRPQLTRRGVRWLAAVVGGLVVLPVIVPIVAAASLSRWMPAPFSAVPWAVVVIVSLVSAGMAAQGAVFVRDAGDDWGQLRAVTRVGWWLLAPGLAAALPLVVGCLVAGLADDGRWAERGPAVVALAVMATVCGALLLAGLALLAIGRTAVWLRGQLTIGYAALALAVVVPLCVSLWVTANALAVP